MNKFVVEIPLSMDGKDLIDEINSIEPDWQRSKTFGGDNPIDGVINDARTSFAKSIVHGSEIDNKIYSFFSHAIQEFNRSVNFPFSYNDEGYQALRYEPGQFYKVHEDDSRTKRRMVSGIIYLNDNYEGGELYFPLIDHLHKPKANTALLFPSNFVFRHEARPVLEGTKYALVTWFG